MYILIYYDCITDLLRHGHMHLHDLLHLLVGDTFLLHDLRHMHHLFLRGSAQP